MTGTERRECCGERYRQDDQTGPGEQGRRTGDIGAERGQTECGICSTTFLEKAFRTDAYRLDVKFNADGTWSYVSDTILTVKGREAPFTHRDRNTLRKVGEPDLNPWLKIVNGNHP